MTFPATTAFYAAILALLYLGLTAWVFTGRLTKDTLHGDGGDQDLQKRIRSHANFGEYVPFALLLIALVEGGGGSQILVQALLVILLVARLIQPFGMFAPKNSPQQFACRGGAILASMGVILVAAGALLLR